MCLLFRFFLTVTFWEVTSSASFVTFSRQVEWPTRPGGVQRRAADCGPHDAWRTGRAVSERRRLVHWFLTLKFHGSFMEVSWNNWMLIELLNSGLLLLNEGISNFNTNGRSSAVLLQWKPWNQKARRFKRQVVWRWGGGKWWVFKRWTIDFWGISTSLHDFWMGLAPFLNHCSFVMLV